MPFAYTNQPTDLRDDQWKPHDPWDLHYTATGDQNRDDELETYLAGLGSGVLAFATAAARDASQPTTGQIAFVVAEGLYYSYNGGWNLTNIVPDAWVNVTFKNSWVNTAADQVVQYRRFGDMVQVRGNCQNGTINTVVFTLPTGYRPPGGGNNFAVMSNGAFSYATIDGGGDVYAFTGSNAKFCFGLIQISTRS